MRRLLLLALAAIGLLAASWLASCPGDRGTAPPDAPHDAAAAATTPAAPTGSASSPTAPRPSTTTGDTDRREVAAAHRVHGRLLHEGAPLANVPLRVFAMPERSATEIAATTTDAEGGFTFVMPTQRFFFLAFAPSVPHDWWSAWQFPQASDWDLGDMQVPAGGAIEGTVRDPAGRGVAQAEVRASFGSYERVPIAGTNTAPPVPTDAAGHFRIEQLRPGSYHLSASMPGLTIGEQDTTVLEGATVAVDFDLRTTRRRTGFVFDWRGLPLAGARAACAKGGQVVTTDARGWFAIDDYTDGDDVHITADGHLEQWLSGITGRGMEKVQLGRAVTLRGSVHGTNGAPTTVLLREAPDAASDAVGAKPHDLIGQPLPVAADGTFAIEGLATADLLVSAETAGIGASPPLRVALREHTSVELTIEPGSTLRIVVRDPDGQAIDGAEVVVDPCVADYPTLYGPQVNGVQARILGSNKKQVAKAKAGTVVLARQTDQPFAFAAQHAGFLPDHRVLAAGEAPAEIVLTLPRAGSVRGVLHGGSDTGCTRSVEIWRADEEPRTAAEVAAAAEAMLWPSTWSSSLVVDAAGRFVRNGQRPGAWRAAVTRWGRAHVDNGPDELVGAVPLLDDGRDLRSVVDFVVTAGAETTIELSEPPLGTLRGRVLLRGLPCAEAQVFGTRPDWGHDSLSRSLFENEGPPDWDAKLVRGWAPGQRVAADGTFAFEYRDAGPVELRVRHASGAATLPPVIVHLPPPGADVHCTLEMAVGGVRGRFLIEQVPERERRSTQAVLYPLPKANGDPGYFTDLGTPIAWNCAHLDLPADGRFSFEFLPDGEWLVRVQGSAFGDDPGVRWQQVVHVQGDVVDLGDTVPPARVTADLHWSWPAGDATVRTVAGLWLHLAHGGDEAAIWAGTHHAGENGTTLRGVPPGRYEVVVFGCFDTHLWYFLGTWGISGSPLAKPFQIEVHTDGTVTPAELTLQPLPPPKPR